MADYNVQSSDGTFTVNVQTGTINNTFDIPFIGQDAINYGDDLVAAQLRQLENFSNTSEPAFGTARVKGQLWYDSTPSTGRLNIFDGSQFVEIPLDLDVVHISGTETILGAKTFSTAPIFTASGAPLTVNSDTVVPNLNADKLDGQHATAFATFSQGLLADAAQPALPLNTSGAGYVLSADLTNPNNYTWISPSVTAGQVATDPTPTIDTTTNVLLVGDEGATSGGTVQDPLYSTNLTFDPSGSGELVTGVFLGNLTGNATTADSATTATTAVGATNIDIDATTSTDSASYLVLVGTNATGNQVPFIDNASLWYDANNNRLNADEFVGDGFLITNLDLTSGTHQGPLAVNVGGTGVTASTGSGGSFALSTSPTFGTDITVPLILSASGVAIQWNGATMVQTQDRTATGNTTGAQIRHHDNTLYDVGMNVLPQFNFNANDTLEAQHCGMMTGTDNSTAYTLTIPVNTDVDFPVGGIATIANVGTVEDYTIVDDATATLYYVEPGIGRTDVAGSCTIGLGGIATLWRFDAATYYIWGSEITP